MKKHIGSLAVAILLSGSVAAHSQIYVPIPPTTGENRLQLLLTNLGAKPTFFRSRIYSPVTPPSTQGRFDLQAGQSVFQEQAGTIGGFQVVDINDPGVTASLRLTGPDEDDACRLPVFTSRDIVPRRKKVTFQLSPRLEPDESVSFVVFSVTLTKATCSVTLHNHSGRIASSSLTVPESTAVAVAELSLSSAEFAQVTCNKPFLSFAYHGTAPTVEVIGPSTPQ
jgi:hypothetical protein